MKKSAESNVERMDLVFWEWRGVWRHLTLQPITFLLFRTELNNQEVRKDSRGAVSQVGQVIWGGCL